MAIHNTTKKKKRYTRLTAEERDLIAEMLTQKYSIRAIARRTGRNVSTISREIRRNLNPKSLKYGSGKATILAAERQRKASKRQRIADLATRIYIENRLKDGITPEFITYELKIRSDLKNVSHETIYQYIYNEKPVLSQKLPRKRKRRKKRKEPGKKKKRIPFRVSIHFRPIEIWKKLIFGHWEADTMLSPRGYKGALCVMVERTTRFVLIAKMQGNNSDEMLRALKYNMRKLDRKDFKSITYDNGSENVLHYVVNQFFNTKSYFCDPHSPYQKGAVENRIGVIRRTFPKGTKLSKVDAKSIKELEWKLNNSPIKCLGYRTPQEAFLESVALRT